jgi:hypothetical protein
MAKRYSNCHLLKKLGLRLTYAYVMYDRLCGLVVRVPGYRTEKYCVSYEVRTEFISYVEESRPFHPYQKD